MKKLTLAILVLCMSVAYAAEINLLEASYRSAHNYPTQINSRFVIDMDTYEAYVKVEAIEERVISSGSSRSHLPHRMTVIVFNDQVKVAGLMLMGDKIIYHGESADIECGTMGVSRVFKRPTIHLNGNCRLSSQIIENRNQRKVIVKLITK